MSIEYCAEPTCVCNQTWKTESYGEQLVAKCDYYDLSIFLSLSPSYHLIDELQNRSKTSQMKNKPKNK